MIYVLSIIINSSVDFKQLNENPEGIFYMNTTITTTNGIKKAFRGVLMGNGI